MQSWNTYGKLFSEIMKESLIHPCRKSYITIEKGGRITTETLDRASKPHDRAHPLASVSNALHQLYTHALAH